VTYSNDNSRGFSATAELLVRVTGKAGSIEVFRKGSRIATLVNLTSYNYNDPKIFR